MIHYLDTSALVKRYVEEEGSSEVNSLFRRQSSIATSRITYVEACAAVARSVREKRLPATAHAKLRDRIHEDLDLLAIVEVSREVLQGAANLCAEHPLRAYDAVHVSSALVLSEEVDPEVRFVCADRTLSRIAEQSGLQIWKL